MNTQLVQWKMDSKIGPIYLVASPKSLHGIFFSPQRWPIAKSLEDPSLKVLALAVSQLEQYFRGERKDFDLPLHIEATDFQKKVWAELQKIPYGETRSYKDIALRIQNPKSMRAVGLANGKNSFCIVVPCHRVISADGSLGGYSGGLHLKTALLELER